MTHVEIRDATRDRAGGYKMVVSRGERIGRVSSEWFSRSADERYLSQSDFYAAVHRRTERSRTRTVESAATLVEASRDDAERLSLMLPRMRRSRRRIGALASLPAWSASRRPICASFRRRSPGSTSNTG
ncbi:hypothetical protein [Pseudoxanthomonas sp. USHLN014]|uniref:hypothetical protein n=1 Tax=Pseudoxanthomonas sp. USHLN014 TaxID=3081297 RepID=UPI00301C44DC